MVNSRGGDQNDQVLDNESVPIRRVRPMEKAGSRDSKKNPATNLEAAKWFSLRASDQLKLAEYRVQLQRVGPGTIKLVELGTLQHRLEYRHERKPGSGRNKEGRRCAIYASTRHARRTGQ